jgi:hypothetical protein
LLFGWNWWSRAVLAVWAGADIFEVHRGSITHPGVCVSQALALGNYKKVLVLDGIQS